MSVFPVGRRKVSHFCTSTEKLHVFTSIDIYKKKKYYVSAILKIQHTCQLPGDLVKMQF